MRPLVASLILLAGAASGVAFLLAWQAGLLQPTLSCILLTVTILLLAVVLVLALRRIGQFPSELDRLGSDLNLYGYGIGLSFLFGTYFGRPVLRLIPSEHTVFLITVVALLISLILYGANLWLSNKIRQLHPRKYIHGVETIRDLLDVFADKRGCRLLGGSLAIGFFPTLLLVLFDTLSR